MRMNRLWLTALLTSACGMHGDGSVDTAQMRKAVAAMQARIDAHDERVSAATERKAVLAEVELYGKEMDPLAREMMGSCIGVMNDMMQMMGGNWRGDTTQSDRMSDMMMAAVRDHMANMQATEDLDEMKAIGTEHHEQMSAMTDHMNGMTEMMNMMGSMHD